MSAILSSCRSYRFELQRACGLGGGEICWVMFNPSTADAERDDQTIRRVRGFSNRWGYGLLTVVNLFPLRAPDPQDVIRYYDHPPIGGEYFENLRYVDRAVRRARAVVAAWGHMGARLGGDAMREMLWEIRDDVKCLGILRDLQPRHPLYVKKQAQLQPFTNEALK